MEQRCILSEFVSILHMEAIAVIVFLNSLIHVQVVDDSYGGLVIAVS